MILMALCLVAVLAGTLAVLFIGSSLSSPRPSVVGLLPGEIHGQSAEFKSYSGSKIRGWFLPGVTNHGAVILMHGVRGNRESMLGRARFLNAAGYTVLLFDFQAHGESEGQRITFGYLESEDAKAAVDFVRAKVPREKIAVLGTSLGGAAALLADPPLKVDAMILEMVYPTIRQAVADRLRMQCGPWGPLFTPLLTAQLKPRLGCSSDDLRPIEKVRALTIPKLFIAGTKDRHTTLAESMEMFQAAAGPKEWWAVEGAAHEDLHKFAKSEYEGHVLEFLKTRIR
jgi:fermentation-respiration switch protein FrsA (DUF1100 family)